MRTLIYTALLALALLAGPAHAAETESCPTRALNVLLTNDDGYGTPGINALHQALTDAGHNVKRVAPARNFSGSSACMVGCRA